MTQIQLKAWIEKNLGSDNPYFLRIIRIGTETRKLVVENQIPLAASGLAYTTLISIVPLLAVSFSIFKAFGGLQQIYDRFLPLLFSNLTESTGDQVQGYLSSFIENAHAGAVGATGLAGLILTSFTMLSSIEKSINRLWKIQVTRPLFYRVAIYWLFTTLGPVAAALLLGGVTSGNIKWLSEIPADFGMFLASFLFFAFIYREVPQRKVFWRSAAVGALFTATAFKLAQIGFSFYVSHIVNFNKLYGSLASIPLFLIWIYILWFIVLTGASISCVYQKRKDS